jgi:hypothetical protein
MSEEHELMATLKKLRYDLTSMQVKVSEAIRFAASLDLPAPSQRTCEKCSAVFPGKLSLAEHVYLSHGGPEPEHWLEAERRASEVA